MSNAPVKLEANRNCKYCRGEGHVWESHEPSLGREKFVCECVFDNAPSDEKTLAAIDSDNFEVVSTADCSRL
jgi:hypothetical protein